MYCFALDGTHEHRSFVSPVHSVTAATMNHTIVVLFGVVVLYTLNWLFYAKQPSSAVGVVELA
jgi:hypothetical protein